MFKLYRASGKTKSRRLWVVKYCNKVIETYKVKSKPMCGKHIRYLKRIRPLDSELRSITLLRPQAKVLLRLQQDREDLPGIGQIGSPEFHNQQTIINYPPANRTPDGWNRNPAALRTRWSRDVESVCHVYPQSGYRGRGSKSRRDASITQSPYDLCRFGGTLALEGLSRNHKLTCRFKTSQNRIIYASCGIIIIAGRMEIDGNGKNHQAASLWRSLLLPIPLRVSIPGPPRDFAKQRTSNRSHLGFQWILLAGTFHVRFHMVS